MSVTADPRLPPGVGFDEAAFAFVRIPTAADGSGEPGDPLASLRPHEDTAEELAEDPTAPDADVWDAVLAALRAEPDAEGDTAG